MVRLRYNQGWARRGFTLLWDWEVLTSIVEPNEVVSLRDFMRMAADSADNGWPEDLPAAGGDAIVVSGVEGCLDVLAGDDASRWLEHDLKDAVLSFQDYYEGQAGLVFWMPSGSRRMKMTGATEKYFWTHRPSGADGLPVGGLLFSGAENEVERIMDTDDENADYDGKHWVGLHHPRIS